MNQTSIVDPSFIVNLVGALGASISADNTLRNNAEAFIKQVITYIIN